MTARRWGLVAVVALVFLIGLVVRRVARPDGAFRIPAGWLDVSTDAPPANLARLPSDLRAPVQELAKGVKRYALDIDHLDPARGSVATFAAGYVEGTGPVTEASVRDLVRSSLEDVGVQSKEPAVVALRPVGQALLGRAMVEVVSPDVRIVLYVFVHAGRRSMISCTMPRETVTRVEPICDEAAASNVE